MPDQDHLSIQWDGTNIREIIEHMDPVEPVYMAGFTNRNEIIGVPTKAELKVAHIGDWVRRYDNGELDVIPDAQVHAELYRHITGGNHA